MKNPLARLGEAHHFFASTNEEREAEFVFKLLNGLADPGLRPTEGKGDIGEIKGIETCLAKNFKLLQIHEPRVYART